MTALRWRSASALTLALLASIAGAEGLPDFSRAGCGGGQALAARPERSLDLRDFGAVAELHSDVAPALQRAIDAAADRADGGAAVVVKIPPGRWPLLAPVRVRAGSVVLRGAGAERTVFACPRALTDVRGASRSWSWSGAFFELEPRGAKSERVAELTEAAAAGSRRLSCRLVGAPPRVGEWLELCWFNDRGTDSLLDHLYGGAVERAHMGAELKEAEGPRVRAWVRVLEVVPGQLVIDRPIRIDARPEWRVCLNRRPVLRGCGLESFAVEFPATSYPGHLKERGYNAVQLVAAVDCWVQDVAVTNADSGVFLNRCAQVTVSRVRLRGRRMHHGFSLSWSNDCLVQDWRIEAPHRHGTTVSWAAHGNVFSRGFGFELACDAHRAVPFENLHTELVIAQRALPARPFRSGGKRGRGLHAARSNVYWNVRFEFSEAAPEQVSIEGFSEWPRAVFRGWRGNRALLMRAAPGLAQSLGELNVTPRIANLYEHQRAASRRPLERR